MTQLYTPVIDFHCDLLSYLAHAPDRSALDPISRASLPQMQQGKVALQVLAIYVPNSSKAPSLCRQQLARFLALANQHPDYVERFDPDSIKTGLTVGKTQILAAFENAAGFCSESDSVEVAIEELEKMKKQLNHIAYISMTWDGENRYGGGVGSKVGLKEDGKRLLDWMEGKQIAIDLSHASDYLIDDIFNTIDRKSYRIPVLASHSNLRAVTVMARNLPDELASEIITRKGLIGMNFFCHFSGGKHSADLLKHIEHTFLLRGQDSICLGADFFADADLSTIKAKYNSDRCFYDDLSNSSCYPYFFDMVREGLKLKEEAVKAIAYENARAFLSKIFLC